MRVNLGHKILIGIWRQINPVHFVDKITIELSFIPFEGIYNNDINRYRNNKETRVSFGDLRSRGKGCMDPVIDRPDGDKTTINHKPNLPCFDGLYSTHVWQIWRWFITCTSSSSRRGSRLRIFFPRAWYSRAPFRRPIKRWGGGYASPSEKERSVGGLDLCGMLGAQLHHQTCCKTVDIFLWDESWLLWDMFLSASI